MPLLQRNAGANHEQPSTRAAGTAGDRCAGLDFIEADVEAECEVGFSEPARASAVVRRRQRFGVGARGGGARRMQRPLRPADTAAQIAPSMPRAEIERELRRQHPQAFVDGNQSGRAIRRRAEDVRGLRHLLQPPLTPDESRQPKVRDDDKRTAGRGIQLGQHRTRSPARSPVTRRPPTPCRHRSASGGTESQIEARRRQIWPRSTSAPPGSPSARRRHTAPSSFTATAAWARRTCSMPSRMAWPRTGTRRRGSTPTLR